jgi:CHAD domain-containing protein
MSDLEKILVTSMLTILGGVVVFVVGQLLSKFVIEPVHELRKAIGEVRYNLLFFAPDILTPIGRTRESCDKVRDALRKNSSDLYIRSEAIRFYPLASWVFRGSVPRREKVADAAKWLRGLSTYMHETGEKANSHIEDVGGIIKRIERDLGLPSVHES